jgi:ATP-dependent Lon protease
VRRDVAMTGEITLRGEVLPIGGVKEKVLAARAARIRTIILPKQNRRDVVQISSKIVHEITFHYVESMQEVLDIALMPADSESTAAEAPPGATPPDASVREIPVTASGGRRRAPSSPTPRA